MGFKRSVNSDTRHFRLGELFHVLRELNVVAGELVEFRFEHVEPLVHALAHPGLADGQGAPRCTRATKENPGDVAWA